jgi:LysR family transcriptional activator of nhaA
VKLEGVTKAATYLHTSQSSLSTQMKQLEEAFGKKLLEKVGRKLVLTSDGQIIYSYCKLSFENIEDMTRQLNNKTKTGIQRLKIGVSDEIERPFISSVVGNLIKRDLQNDFQIFLHSAKHDDIKEKFLVKDVDFAITSDPILANNIKHQAVISLPVSFLVNPKALALSKSAKLNIKDFFKNGEMDLALPSSSLKLRKEIDNYLTKNKINRNVTFETNILSTLIRSIVDGVACGFIPTAYVETELREKRIVQIGADQKLWEHKLYLYSYNSTLLFDVRKEIERLSNIKVS